MYIQLVSRTHSPLLGNVNNIIFMAQFPKTIQLFSDPKATAKIKHSKVIAMLKDEVRFYRLYSVARNREIDMLSFIIHEN